MPLSYAAAALWNWRPGHRAFDGQRRRWRLCFVDKRDWGLSAFLEGGRKVTTVPWVKLQQRECLVPDLGDAVTAAYLPQVVRAVWKDEGAYCRPLIAPQGVFFRAAVHAHEFDGSTMLEAWTAALEAAASIPVRQV